TSTTRSPPSSTSPGSPEPTSVNRNGNPPNATPPTPPTCSPAPADRGRPSPSPPRRSRTAVPSDRAPRTARHDPPATGALSMTCPSGRQAGSAAAGGWGGGAGETAADAADIGDGPVGGAVEGDGVGGGGGDAVGGLLALGGHVDEDLHHVAVALGFRQVGGEQAGGGGVLHLAQPGADHVDGGVELGGQLCGDALGERGA